MPKLSLSPIWKAEYLHQITWSFGKGLSVLKMNLIRAECVICTDISETFRFLNVKYKISFSRGVRLTHFSQLVCLQKVYGLKIILDSSNASWLKLSLSWTLNSQAYCNKKFQITTWASPRSLKRMRMKIHSCFGGLCGIRLWPSTQLEMSVHMEYTLTKNGWSPRQTMALVILGRPIKNCFHLSKHCKQVLLDAKDQKTPSSYLWKISLSFFFFLFGPFSSYVR